MEEDDNEGVVLMVMIQDGGSSAPRLFLFLRKQIKVRCVSFRECERASYGAMEWGRGVVGEGWGRVVQRGQ